MVFGHVGRVLDPQVDQVYVEAVRVVVADPLTPPVKVNLADDALPGRNQTRL